MTWILGLRALRTWPTPVMVPPVPIPAMKMSTAPSVSFHISSAVVSRWMRGLASFANWWARMPPRSAAISSDLATAPFIPSEPGVRMSSAPKAASSILRSLLIVSGMVSTTLYPRAAPTIASAIPVLPLVASTIVPPGLSWPDLSAASTIATPIRSFTEPAGFWNSSLAAMAAPAPALSRLIRTSGVLPTMAVTSSWMGNGTTLCEWVNGEVC
jgi:hypothetical protein